MQQLLPSYDQSPPIAVPFRFFLAAPVFGVLAGLLVLWRGEEVFLSRWTPAALALTHLLTVGFMLQAMLGALLQILPVLLGVRIARSNDVSRLIFVLTGSGALFLAAAFLNFTSWQFIVATLLLGSGIALFLGAAGWALYGVPSDNPTARGLKYSLLGLGVTAVLGLLLSSSLGWSLNLPLIELTDIHLSWGFVGWGTILVAAVAYVVVPLFQLTPPYPEWFGRWFSIAALAAVAIWSGARFAEMEAMNFAPSAFGAIMVALVAGFALITLNTQRKSKRPSFDASQHFWRIAMLNVLAACMVWLVAQLWPSFGEWPGWPLLCGVFVVVGGFMSVIVGMLYKIVPFLAWLHLQNQGGGRLMAPNMKKFIAEREMKRQMLAHLLSLALLLLAVVWPDTFAPPSGLALLLANAWLLRNLLGAVSCYRRHLAVIRATAEHEATP